jgi:hypothetical protein
MTGARRLSSGFVCLAGISETTDTFPRLCLTRTAGTTLHSPAGEMIVFSIERAYARRPVPPDAGRELDGLRHTDDRTYLRHGWQPRADRVAGEATCGRLLQPDPSSFHE